MIMLFIILLSVVKELSATSLALNSKIYLCAVSELSEALVDGNKKFGIKLSNTGDCTRNVFLSITLGRPYHVHYVIVNSGTSTKIISVNPPFCSHELPSYPTETNPSLDYFKVFTGESHLCAQFEKCFSSVRRGSGMRVNCLARSEHDSTVQVHLIRKSENFMISEIGVYTLAPPKPEKTIIFPRGCFKKFVKVESKTFVDLNTCWKGCFARGFPLMAVEEGRRCHCGTDLPIESEVAPEDCHNECPDYDGHCGGVKTYSVYIIRIQLPYFYGCSNISQPKKTMEGNLTIWKCLKYCDSYPYAWMRDNVCGCLEKAGHLDRSPIRCSTPCSGDSRDVCGGNGRASVYGTCLRTLKFLTCDTLLQCDGTYDRYGRCQRGCRIGFGGPYCIDRIHPGIYIKFKRPTGVVANTSIFCVIVASIVICYLLLPGKKELLMEKLTHMFRSKSTVTPED